MSALCIAQVIIENLVYTVGHFENSVGQLRGNPDMTPSLTF